jgi:hypothetical protein
MQYSDLPTLVSRASVCGLLMSAFAALSAEDPAVAQDSVGDSRATHAIWLSRTVPFEYRGDRTAYTCESFKEKVRAVLLAVGVHPSLIVGLRCERASPQSTGRRPSPSIFQGEVEIPSTGPTHIGGTSSRISARIALAAPAIANEQNIRDATTFDAQRRLLAEMRNEELPTPTTIPIFPAVWTSITLSGKTNPWLEPDDCELLRQLSQQVLPTIGIKVTRKVTCSGAKISRPSLMVEALVGAGP